MNQITIAWIALPFVIGFCAYLLPNLARFFALFTAVASAGYTFKVFLEQSTTTLELLDSFGVTLVVDELSGYFILTNALVMLAVVLYCQGSDKSYFCTAV